MILARDGEHNADEKCTNLIGDLAGSISIKRPKDVKLYMLSSTFPANILLMQLLHVGMHLSRVFICYGRFGACVYGKFQPHI
ncbi:hypothetical protein R6Q59_035977 [Mikania micrantha]